MTTNGNNLDPEFDALLAAHIKTQGAAQLAICEQFDPDTASAYLERALTQQALISYETHLADCVSCRRQITALAQLMPAPAAATNVVVAEPATRKQGWREWFTGWRLGALAGVGAITATALLLAVFLPRSSSETLVARQASEEVSIVQASPLPDASSATEFRKDNPAMVGSPLATPVITMRGNTTADSAPIPAPSAASSEAAPPPPPPASAPKATPEERKEMAGERARNVDDLAAVSNQARNVQNLTPSGPAVNQNQIQTERQLERANRADPAAIPSAGASAPKQPEKAEQGKQALSDSVATRREEAYAKKSTDVEGGRKDDKAKMVSPPIIATSAARPARPVRTVAGKSFRLENAVWVDAEYDASKGVAVIRLQQNSDEYKQTLQDIPGLKPYFELAPVLVLWQGKAYRLEKK